MDDEAVKALADQVYVWRVQGYAAVASATILVYYYMTTFDQEVSKIWPQPNWKLGKILYLTSRYFNYARVVIISTYGWPNHITFSLSTCTALQRAWWGMAVIGVTLAPECVYWLCLYALLGGGPTYLILMVTVFLLFFIPIQILQGIYVYDMTAIPLSQLRSELGFVCTQGPSSKPIILYTSAAYLGLARTTLIMIVAVVTLVVRYWKHNNTLINVIRREGAAYYMVAFVIGFINSVANTPPHPPIQDKYIIIRFVREAFIPMFADRLVLKMQRASDPSTEATSTLIFGKYSRDGGPIPEYALDDDETVVHQSTVDESPSAPLELQERRTAS